MKTYSPSETDIQIALVDWCSLKGLPVWHTPNGGKRSITEAKRFQRLGVKAGVPDLFIPLQRKGFGGMFLEVKSAKGRLSESQKFWVGYLAAQGYHVKTCHSVDEGIRLIEEYAGL